MTILLEDESLRDGLQFEQKILSLDEKITIFQRLKEAGVKRIQIGSFVHPKIVPQMADTDQFVEHLAKEEDVLLTGLVLNEKGLERAVTSGLKHISLSCSASNSHSLKNVKRTKREALENVSSIIEKAVRKGITVRAGVQCSFGCVYEGNISKNTVLQTVERMIRAGASEVNLADTAGMATPTIVKEVVGLIQEEFPEIEISLHFHDTRGLGLVNLVAGYEMGVKIFDTSVGGLGGCPFVKGAAGNIATEDAVHLLESFGENTGIDLEKLCKVTELYEKLLDRSLPGRMSKVLQIKNSAD